MTMTLVEQIEEMRIRMHEEARGEQHLVNALGLALKRADEKLLQAIRNVTVEHTSRRECRNCTLWPRVWVPCRYRKGEIACGRMRRSRCEVTRPVCQSAAQATGVKQWPTFPMC
jgi:hypothetical protein